MADYMRLRTEKNNFLNTYKEAFQSASENYGRSAAAALDVQRVFRGVVDREIISKKNYAANEIQRVFRGLVGRMIAHNALSEKLDGRQVSLFHYLCIQIQRCFRGYYSRKYKHDQKRRKEYAKMIAEKGEQVREQMNQYREEVAAREATDATSGEQQEFKALASNLHHLTSTRQIPGVFNPRPDCNIMPTMRGLPVEEHIRGVVKDLLRARGVAHKGLEEDVYGTKRVPLKGLKYRLSIQASTPYDTVEQEKRRQRMLHKILTREKGDWFAGGKSKVLEKKKYIPLSSGDVYMDPWANPMLVKGVPESQKQLLDSAYSHKPLFATQNSRRIQQPYYTRVGGNKSTALPNDVFDTMAEAQQTGGAAQRHLGTTTRRFGLPESADSRYDGVMPSPPLRVTREMRTSRTYKSRSYSNMNSKAKTTGQVGSARPVRSAASVEGEMAMDEIDREMRRGGDEEVFSNAPIDVLYPDDADSSDDEMPGQ